MRGRSPDALHGFLSAYLRYSTHVFAYLFLAANPFPAFQGAPGTYPIDLEIDPPAPQNRWKTGFRLVLVLPALLLASVLRGGGAGGGRAGADDDGGPGFFVSSTGVLMTVAVLGWFACLVRGAMPHGFRNVVAYGLRYTGQAIGYLTLLTDRYPNSDPLLPAEAERPPERPIRLTVEDDLRRSRLTVFFRLLLSLPHLVWLTLWTIAAFFALIASWFATLVRGTSPEALHRFLAAYLRYEVHVFAYLLLVANPFPGFVGQAGSYPVDLEIDPPVRQNRWVTGFRLVLAIPALAVEAGLSGLLLVAGLLGWFAALATGRMPTGLRNLGAYALRYTGESYGYLSLLTDRYPHSSPPVAEPPLAEELPAAA